MSNHHALLRAILALAVGLTLAGLAACSRPTPAPGQATSVPFEQPLGGGDSGPVSSPYPGMAETAAWYAEGNVPPPAEQSPYPGQAETEAAWATGVSPLAGTLAPAEETAPPASTGTP
jgi:hypothetical protein